LLRLHHFIPDFAFLVGFGILSRPPGKRDTLTVAVFEIPVAAFSAPVDKSSFLKVMYQVSNFSGHDLESHHIHCR